MEDLSFTTAIVATYLAYTRKKLGNEGIFLHYQLCVEIAENFNKKYPTGYDWESHRDNGGDDYDIEVEKFVDQYMVKNFYEDLIYWRENEFILLGEQACYQYDETGIEDVKRFDYI